VKRLIVDREAKAELVSAQAWYEEQRAGLGQEFYDEAVGVLERIQQDPGGGAVHLRTGARYFTTRRFPYVVYYLELDDVIWVAAVAHERRRPGYWRRRKPA
jgi:toxin ParE1/3/4